MRKNAVNQLRWITRAVALVILLIAAIMPILLSSPPVFADEHTSTATGGVWATGSTWVGGVAPLTTDTVIIATTGTNSVTVGAAATCAGLTINNGASLSVGGVNFTVNGPTTVSGTILFTSITGTKTFGAVTISNGTWTSNAGETYGISSMILSSSTFGGTATGIFNVGAGGLTVSASTTNTFNAVTITVTGTTTVAGTIIFASATGTKTFTGLVTINSGGIWNNSGNSAITVRGGITNSSGTFTAGTGVHTFNTNAQALTGTFSIPRVTVTGITLTNNNTLTVSTALAGTGTLTQGTNATLNIGGTSAITTLTATASGNTVNFNGAAQTACKVTTYNNLTLSGTLAKSFATTPTVNGILSIEGTATVVVTTGVVTYGANATLQYKTTNVRTATAEEWLTPFAATGGVIIANTAGSITLNNAKVFSTSVPLTINSGATLATNNWALTFGGDFINNGGTFTAGSSAITIAGTADQSIAGFTTTGTVSMTKTSGTATFTGTVNGGALTISGTYPGQLSLGSGFTHTFSGSWTITSTGALSGGSSRLKIGGSSSSSIGGYFWMDQSTVEYYAGGAQTIAGVDYNNLTVSGSGVKTMQASRAPEVEGVLSMEGTATVSGAFVYRANATLQYNRTAAQATTNNEWPATFTATGGVIIANTGTITLNAVKTVNAPLAINTGAKLNLGTWNSTADSLTLGGEEQVPGSWGSTASGATYKNDTYFASSTGILNVATGAKATPAITGIPASQAISYGTASITLGGTVSASGPVYPADGETVSVTINEESQNATISGGAGGFSLSFLTSTIPYSATPYTITYYYAGNANLNAATDTSTALTVNKADTTTGLASSVNPSTYGQSVTFTATVSPSTATGSVEFYDGAISLGINSSLISGIATLSVSTLDVPGSPHSITARYLGDTNYNPSISSAISQTVIAPITIDITAPTDISDWNLDPAIGENTNSGTLVVDVTPGDAIWSVTAKDMDAATSGYMTEWSGSAYGTAKLANLMRVQGPDAEVILPNSAGTDIATGTGDAPSISITFKQYVTWDDDPGTYRIVVTFIGTVN